MRDQAIAYKGGSCVVCGYSRCASALDFHHLDPLEKDFSISSRCTSFEAVRAELDKTVLLCSNCHREAHDGLHPWLVGSLPAGHVDLSDEELFEGPWVVDLDHGSSELD